MPALLDLVCEIESITIIPLARSQPGARSSGLQMHPHAVERDREEMADLGRREFAGNGARGVPHSP